MAQETRNYRPFGVDGTRIRSADKKIERDLLAAAFTGVEQGNLEDQAIDTRVLKDSAITIDKLDAYVKSLLGGQFVREKPIVTVSGQTSFNLGFTPPFPEKTILLVDHYDQEYGADKDFEVSSNILLWKNRHFLLDIDDNLEVRYWLATGLIGHNHSDLYWNKTELSSSTGTTLVGDGNTYTNIVPASGTLKSTLSAIDSILGTMGKLASGYYSGDGNNNRIITQTFAPKFIIITRLNGGTSTITIKTDNMSNKDCMVVDNDSNVVDSDVGIAIIVNGFTVDNKNFCNEIGIMYNWLVLG